MNNVILSFFKQYNIPYKINRSNNTVIYPCFHCHVETTISIIRTRWHCNNCEHSGTLIHLIKFIKDNELNTIKDIQKIKKIYDEKKEIEDIQKILIKIENSQLAKELQEKVFRVLNKRQK
ncbi:hypothetical protein ACWV26_11420 [Rummeliibacillus sp. JY-2-4R]